MKAVISVTTIPDRIGLIGPCMASLAAQGLPVYLWAVPKIARSETRLGRVPSFPGVNVEVVSDRGPITKLLPALERKFDVILTADDDCIYGKGWAAGLLAWAKKLPDAALAYRGRKLRDHRYSTSKLLFRTVKKPVRVELLTGTHGALYRREFFDDSIYEEWKRWPENDDLIVAAHLKRRGVPRYVVPGKCAIKNAPYCRDASLYESNRNRRNNEGMKALGL